MPLGHKGLHRSCTGLAHDIIDDGKVPELDGTYGGEVDGVIHGAFGA